MRSLASRKNVAVARAGHAETACGQQSCQRKLFHAPEVDALEVIDNELPRCLRRDAVRRTSLLRELAHRVKCRWGVRRPGWRKRVMPSSSLSGHFRLTAAARVRHGMGAFSDLENAF